VNKRKVVQRLLVESSLSNRQDYFKQYAILKSLLKQYENEDFWSVVNFGERLKSLYFFKTGYGKKLLDRKYKEFLYKPKRKDREYKLSRKSGKDTVHSKSKTTTRGFLHE